MLLIDGIGALKDGYHYAQQTTNDAVSKCHQQ
jgi:hypothetical protein